MENQFNSLADVADELDYGDQALSQICAFTTVPCSLWINILTRIFPWLTRLEIHGTEVLELVNLHIRASCEHNTLLNTSQSSTGYIGAVAQTPAMLHRSILGYASSGTTLPRARLKR